MPTYEYACKACGEHVEVVQSFKDGPLEECPNCGGELRKVFSPIGIAFKGSGFYKTDSRSGAAKRAGKSGGTSEAKSAPKEPKSGATSEPKSGATSEKKSEAKPAAS